MTFFSVECIDSSKKICIPNCYVLTYFINNLSFYKLDSYGSIFPCPRPFEGRENNCSTHKLCPILRGWIHAING